jgi:hypothetical protein
MEINKINKKVFITEIIMIIIVDMKENMEMDVIDIIS